MKKFGIVLLTLLGLSASVSVAAFREPPAAAVKDALANFKFKGEWIHPLIIKEFLPWESDYNYPLIVAIDLAAASGTNRFFGAVVAEPKGASVKNADGFFAYEWLGRLANGMHALLTRSGGGGGTMVATNLVVFSMHEQFAQDESGKRYRQLILAIERSVVIGDRARPKITLQRNVIKITNPNRQPIETEIKFE